ncbi:MAG TPA: acyl-CoA synthetase, partial [Solirubrobacteraceae bacterium]
MTQFRVMSPSPIDRITNSAFTARTLIDAGIIAPTRPSRLVRLGSTFLRWGPTPAAGYAAAATRYADEPAIIDDLGTLTFSQVHERTNRMAHAFSDRGIGEG